MNWAEGIVFLLVPYQPDSELIIEQASEDAMYSAAAIFSSILECQRTKKFGARETPIIDQTSISYLRQVASWLKKRVKA